jgi:hypothetical protein
MKPEKCVQKAFSEQRSDDGEEQTVKDPVLRLRTSRPACVRTRRSSSSDVCSGEATETLFIARVFVREGSVWSCKGRALLKVDQRRGMAPTHRKISSDAMRCQSWTGRMLQQRLSRCFHQSNRSPLFQRRSATYQLVYELQNIAE